jgi:exodeoxyribonuclease VII large subunit
VAVHGDDDALSITELYQQVDRALRSAFPQEVWITGEIRSIKVLPKGHCFIDLVDPTNARDSAAPTLGVKCWATRWRTVGAALERLGIVLEAGMVVRARGQLQFYKARGTVDFVLSELDTDALLGRVAAERARLVKALVDEDLYDRQRRMPSPVLPLRVGLVASPGTEGYNDFMGGLDKSGMAFEVTVAPTAVQGKVAPGRVAAAITDLGSEPLDLIVVVRGGGSKADLAAFDTESVARAVAVATVPVWTGIGHTGDLSVADEVAHRAFITPTECGQELARTVRDFWRSRLDAGLVVARLARQQMATAEHVLDRHRHTTVTCARSQLDRHGERLVHRSRALRAAARGRLDDHDGQARRRVEGLVKTARRSVANGQEKTADRRRQLVLLSGRRLESEALRLAQWRRLLGAYDYHRQLERGYSVTRDEAGTVVRSTLDVRPGSVLLTHVADGRVVSTVGDPVTPKPDGGRGEDETGARTGQTGAVRTSNTKKGIHDGDREK